MAADEEWSLRGGSEEALVGDGQEKDPKSMQKVEYSSEGVLEEELEAAEEIGGVPERETAPAAAGAGGNPNGSAGKKGKNKGRVKNVKV